MLLSFPTKPSASNSFRIIHVYFCAFQESLKVFLMGRSTFLVKITDIYMAGNLLYS
jgi:hypothetical protein